MRYQVTKLDHRHSHRGQFEYMLEFSKKTWSGTGVIDFDRSRRWMNQTWGWSQDVTTRQALISRLENSDNYTVQDSDINPHWAYSVEYREYRIYLTGEAELNWFVLAHPNESNS
jgi:hypothetical protein